MSQENPFRRGGRIYAQVPVSLTNVPQGLGMNFSALPDSDELEKSSGISGSSINRETPEMRDVQCGEEVRCREVLAE